MGIKSFSSAVASSPRKAAEILSTKRDNFKEGIKSKENFKRYIRTPGSYDDSEGGKWSWSNEGISSLCASLQLEYADCG